MSVVYFAQACRSNCDMGRPLTGFPKVHVAIGDPVDFKPIKIGFSRHLHDRLLTISSLAKARMWLLGAVLGGSFEERRMHRMFAHLRLPPPFRGAGTEWFSPAWELLNFIVSLPTPPLTDLDCTQCAIEATPGRRRLDILDTAYDDTGS